MIGEQVSRGWNIKCFDKVKLTHLSTESRLHSNNFAYKSRSYNTAASCHKVRDESDWFVALRPEDASMSYHFRYGDELLLSHADTRKCLHLSEEVDSPVSKNMEVSLCDESERCCSEDVWLVERADNSQDDYWRVGQPIRLKHRDTSALLCSHRRKLQENDDYEVFAQRLKPPSPEAPTIRHEESLWSVSEIVPFIYTAAISEQKKPKVSEEAEELAKLKATLHAIPKRETKKVDQTEEILKMENRRLEQLQAERRKQQQNAKKASCWKKYLCCCCPQAEGYSQLQ